MQILTLVQGNIFTVSCVAVSQMKFELSTFIF